MIKIKELNRENFVIDDDESVITIENLSHENIKSALKELEIEYEEIDEYQFLVKTADFKKAQKKTKELKKQIKELKQNFEKELTDEEISAMDPLHRAMAKLGKIMSEEFKGLDLNDNKDASYEENIKISRAAHKRKLELINTILTDEERDAYNAEVPLSFDINAPDYVGLNDKDITRFYDESWETVSKEDDFLRFRKPDLILHEAGDNRLPPRALAAYDPTQHIVIVGKLLWETFGNSPIEDDDEIKIKDIFIHEFSHIVCLDHGNKFWDLTGKNDSAGQKIREYHQKQIDEIKKRFEEGK